jgi:hypothetical protein
VLCPLRLMKVDIAVYPADHPAANARVARVAAQMKSPDPWRPGLS